MDIRGAHWIIVTVNGRPVSLCELGPFVSASGLTVCCLDQCSQARLCPCNGQSSDRVRDFVLVVCNVGRRFTTVMMRLKSWTKCLSFTCVWKTTRWLNYYWYYFRFSLHLAILIKGQVNGHEMSDVMVQIAMSSTHPSCSGSRDREDWWDQVQPQPSCWLVSTVSVNKQWNHADWCPQCLSVNNETMLTGVHSVCQ